MTTKRASFLILAVALLLASTPAGADQNDARLKGLFAALKGASTLSSAHRVEAAIWSIWLEHEDPEVTAVMDRGIAAMEQQDLPEALDAFEQAVQMAPDFAEAWNKRATVLFFLGKYDSSMADVDRTLELEPRHFGALSGMGLIFDRQGQPREALSAFERALEIHPMAPGAKINADDLRRRLEDNEI